MIEVNKIYCEDHLVTMGRMPNDFVDLIVTSPPYDNLRDYNGYVFQFEKMAKELYRVTKPGGVVVWVVGDQTKNGSESLTSFKQAIYFREQCGFNLYDTMFHQKAAAAVPTEGRYYDVIDYMFILSKGNPKTINFICDHRNVTEGHRREKQTIINKGKAKDKKGEYFIAPKFSRRTNIWKYATGMDTDLRIIFNDLKLKHPATFPEQLAADHIYSWSNEGDLVFDPMSGSGTVPKMAIKMNRNWIASEISREYCDIIETRTKREQSILKLNFAA